MLGKIASVAERLAAFWSDKEKVDAHRKVEFDNAKMLSDFVGMIIRFAFALAAAGYFGRRALEASWIEKYVFGFCWTMSLGLAIALGSGITSIIFAYEMRSVHNSKNRATSWVFFLIAALFTLVRLVRNQRPRRRDRWIARDSTEKNLGSSIIGSMGCLSNQVRFLMQHLGGILDHLHGSEIEEEPIAH